MRILAPVGPIEYFFVQSGTRIHKTVHYFLMEPTGGDLARHDHEFDEVRWFDLAEAEALMSFPTERDIVARGAATGGPRMTGEAARAAPGRDAARRTRPRCARALYETHRALGARLIDFAGWEMPVQYTGIIEEHRAVRRSAGLFDLSHMGELWVERPRRRRGAWPTPW